MQYKMGKNFFIRKCGFSLIETMIITGLMTTLMLGSMTIMKYSQKNQAKINAVNLRNQLITRFTNFISDPSIILMSAGNQANLFACVGNGSSCATNSTMISSLLRFCGASNDCATKSTQSTCNQWIAGPTTYLSATQKVFCAWSSNACMPLTTNASVNISGSASCPVASTSLILYDQNNQQVSNYYDIQGRSYTTQPNASYYFTVSLSYAGTQPLTKISVSFTITPSTAIANNYGIQTYTSANATYSVPLNPVLLTNSGLCNFLGGTAGTTTCASIPTITFSATLGGSCAYPGTLGHDSSGVLYECNSGQWILPANTGITVGSACAPQGAIGQASTAAYGWGTYVCNGTWVSTNSVLESTVVSQSSTIVSQSGTIGSQSATMTTNANTIASQSTTIGTQSSTISTNTGTLSAQSGTINSNTGTINRFQSAIASYDNILAYQPSTIATQSANIALNSSTIASQSTVIASMSSTVAFMSKCSIQGGTYDNTSASVPMCVFSGSSCPTGFTAYSNFSSTSASQCCGGHNSCALQSNCGNCCTTGSHGFSGQYQETCSYQPKGCSTGGRCQNNGSAQTCYATITEIACI